MMRDSIEFQKVMEEWDKKTAGSSFYESARMAAEEGLLDYFPVAEMLWRRPIMQSESDVSNLVATGENTTDERPEGHITNTDDMS